MTKKESLESLAETIKCTQKPSRFTHTTGVAYTAAALAMCYGGSMEAALTAGYLHDCAKELAYEESLRICEENHLPVTEVERRNPFLLHGKAGAQLAKTVYGVEDEDILNAIWYHTTGRANMSLLEKIIFVADYMEPSRNQAPNLTEIRQLAFLDLDRAVVRILEDTLSYLNAGGGEVDPATEATLRFYRETAKQERGEA